jgi:hypothetical protein
MPSNDFLRRDEKIKLLHDMLQMTQGRQLQWRAVGSKKSATDTKTPERSDAFGANMGTQPSRWAFLLKSVDRDGVAPFELTVYRNVASEEVLRIRMTALDEDGDEGVNDLISELYEEVFRQVVRPEEVISELFQAIERAKKMPPSVG